MEQANELGDRTTPSIDPLTSHRRQRSKRRALLAVGALVIAVPGGLWAGLTKDPIRGTGDGFNRDVPAGFEFERGVIIEEPAIPFPIPTPAPRLP